MKHKPVTTSFLLALGTLIPLLMHSQVTPQNLMLNLNGQQSQVPVTRLNGHSYIDVEALARAANGTISFQGNTMVLTVQGSSSTPPADSPAPQSNQGLTKEFLRAGIEAMAAIREWRSVLSNGVANSYPVTSLGLDSYRAQAAQAVRLASVAASTDGDRSAAQLVSNEFDNMKKLSDRILAKGQSLIYISPDAVTSDPLDKQIITCAHALAAMASSGQFLDESTCH